MIVATEANGGYTVAVGASEVDGWNRGWPCSTLRGRQLFTFDAAGDLIDRDGDGDGPEAVALSEDAQEYARKLLGRPRR